MQPIEGTSDVYLCVQKKNPKKAYALTTTDITKVHTTEIVMQANVLRGFNLMEQLLPSQQTGPDGKLFWMEQLHDGSLERFMIQHLFTTTLRKQCQILSVSKLHNKFVQEKFLMELKLACSTKYRDKSLSQLVKLLFHGTNTTNPKDIWQSEQGLDMRFSRDGMYGQGIYFADNAEYSHRYAFHTQENGMTVHSLFMCFVLTGDSCKFD